jgi:hypothetical protein
MSGAAAARAPRIICAEAGVRVVAHSFSPLQSLLARPPSDSRRQTSSPAVERVLRASKRSRITTGTKPSRLAGIRARARHPDRRHVLRRLVSERRTKGEDSRPFWRTTPDRRERGGRGGKSVLRMPRHAIATARAAEARSVLTGRDIRRSRHVAATGITRWDGQSMDIHDGEGTKEGRGSAGSTPDGSRLITSRGSESRVVGWWEGGGGMG